MLVAGPELAKQSLMAMEVFDSRTNAAQGALPEGEKLEKSQLLRLRTEHRMRKQRRIEQIQYAMNTGKVLEID